MAEPTVKEDEVLADVKHIFHPYLDAMRAMMERVWFRNILYYMGEQWLSWDDELGIFGYQFPLQYDVPTPVSDIVKDFVRSMKALILNKRYKTRVWPNSNDRRDIDAAKLGDQIVDWFDYRDTMALEDLKEDVALWMVLTGSGFSRTFPNMDTGKYVIGKDGKVTVGRGDVSFTDLLPYDIYVPTLGRKLDDKRYVGIKSLVFTEWVEDTYKIIVQPDASDVNKADYQRRLMVLMSNVSAWKGRGIDREMLSAPKEKLSVLHEIEYKPTKTHPKGRYVVSVGEKVAKNENELPIRVGEDGSWFYTVTHYPYNRVPGGFWPTGGVDSLISPQNTINRVDQGLEINRESLGRPYVLTPAELVLKRISSKGQALLALQYDGRLSGGGRPEVKAGTPYPQQVLEERKIHQRVAQEAAGDPKNILRGEAPFAGAPGIAIDTLRETAEMSHSPDINRFYRSWTKCKRKGLVIAGYLYTDTRILKIPGKGNDHLIRAFKGSDLYGHNDLRLEPDSGLATTNAGKNQVIIDLVQNQFFNDETVPPDIRRELMSRLGFSSFPEESNVHRDKAEWENSVLMEGSKELKHVALPSGNGNKEMEGNDPGFVFDDHQAHLQEHLQRILSREFISLKEDAQRRLVAHALMHKEALAAEMEQQMEREARQVAMSRADNAQIGAQAG
jgi:hypothetical protein